MSLKLFTTSASIRGTGTSRLRDLHESVYVWATSEDEVKSFLATHPRYRYDSIDRPSIYAVNPGDFSLLTTLNSNRP